MTLEDFIAEGEEKLRERESVAYASLWTDFFNEHIFPLFPSELHGCLKLSHKWLLAQKPDAHSRIDLVLRASPEELQAWRLPPNMEFVLLVRRIADDIEDETEGLVKESLSPTEGKVKVDLSYSMVPEAVVASDYGGHLVPEYSLKAARKIASMPEVLAFARREYERFAYLSSVKKQLQIANYVDSPLLNKKFFEGLNEGSDIKIVRDLS